MRSLDSSVCAVLASVNGEKIVFTATCGKDVVAKGIKAGDLVRETAKAAGGNGQILDMQYYSYGDKITIPDEPSQVGFVFAGWSMSESEIQNELMKGNDVTVLAKWNVQQEYC